MYNKGKRICNKVTIKDGSLTFVARFWWLLATDYKGQLFKGKTMENIHLANFKRLTVDRWSLFKGGRLNNFDGLCY